MKYLDNHLDCIVFFILAGLTFSTIFALSSPALYLTDEWITVNQLHQLSNGSQLLNTEGKYGRLFTGETSLYFTTRGNYLAYSLFLPIISFPALKLVLILGDFFRFGFLMIWGIITLISLLLFIFLLTRVGNNIYTRLIYLLIALFTIFFLANLLFYSPFPSSANDSPVESAAIIFTNELLPALMAGFLYLMYLNIFKNRRMAISAALISLFCSSYLFWSTTGKDHTLIAFLLTLSLYLCSEMIKKENLWSNFGFFFVLGLIAWARPEIGFFILAGGISWFIIQTYLDKKDPLHESTQYSGLKAFIPLTGIVVGLVPFFINNTLLTGNPFIPTQILYLQERGFASNQTITTTAQGIVSSVNDQVHFTVIGKIINFFTPQLSYWASDLYGIFFYPGTGAAGILFLCPIAIVACISLIIWSKEETYKFNRVERGILQYSLILMAIIFVTHLRGLHGLNISAGIYPDIRYLSPLYLVLGIISIIILHKTRLISEITLIRSLILSSIFIPFILIGGMILTGPFGGLLLGQYQFLWVIAYILTITTSILILLPIRIKLKSTIFSILLAFLAIVPLTWQIMLISLYAVVKMNGYPYWLPIAEYIMNTFLMAVK